MHYEHFSLERWSYQSNQLEYIDSVFFLKLQYRYTLLPLSPYLKTFLNSSTIALTDINGTKIIDIRRNVISTGKGLSDINEYEPFNEFLLDRK